ncbi:MAG: hypothetical protein KZQ99_17200 [Candidatus Thiodiazotropha sp. (ex Dulcina madagascariensis)]|nr:hypothetical protein [Candidatus Thiodiazotropha sp. (ex Dulcina madagascariensis)]
MSENHSKANALSDRALELVMRDVLNGLRDLSLQLQENSMQVETASGSPLAGGGQAHASLSSGHSTIPRLKKSS